jgi:translin
MLLGDAQKDLADAKADLSVHLEIFHAGFISDAEKEFAEGHITLAIVAALELPTPEKLDVGLAAYLNGMGEAGGELRRYILDGLRNGEIDRCEELLAAMEEIYNVLTSMDFPEALTGGLRRTTDMVRGVLERTRGDLTLAVRQRELELQLKQHNLDKTNL